MKIKFNNFRFKFRKRLTLIVMRTFIILFCTTVFGLTPESSLSQAKIVINQDQLITVNQVFSIIKKQTKYSFIYPKSLFKNLPKIQLKKGEIELAELLNQSLVSSNMKFEISSDKTIVIKEEPIQQPSPNKKEIIQTFKVSGVITTGKGEPLPGANIIEKGTNNGIQSDLDGKFSITVKNANATIEISFLGFQTREIAINGQSTITIVLMEDASSLNEVVVVGYGVKKKVTVTGAVVEIKTAEILQSKTANLANNLTGRIAGLVINSRGGEPGKDEVSIRIRGIGTTGNTEPLYVIDGIPNRGNFERLNPEDIESISILKDASAAIYGAQSANGVILVTTKRGKSGKTTFSYSQSYSLAQPTRRPHLMNAQQYLTWIDEINTRNNKPTEWQSIIRQYRDGTIDRTIWGDTDWWDVVTDDWTPQIQHALNVSGGGEKSKFYISGQFSNQDAIYSGDAYGYKQYNLRSNVDTQIANNFKLGVDFSIRAGDNNSPTLDTDGLIRQVFVQKPYEFPYFENGLVRKTSAGSPINLVNGNSGSKSTKTKKFDSKFSLRWDLPFVTKGLYADGYAAIDFYTTTRKDLSKPFDQYELDETTGEYINLKYQTGTISLFQQYSEELNKTFHFKLGYDRTFGKNNISTFMAYEQSKQFGEYFFASRQGLISADIPFLFTGSDVNIQNGGKGDKNTARQNYFGRLNYGFDEKYLVDLTMRYDGSANFAKGNRFGFFPSVSLGWRISKENFFKSDLITELKLRSSWGLLGNDRVDNFQYLQIYNVGNSYVYGENPVRSNGLTPGKEPNPNITWETSEKINIGIDIRFKRALLEGSIDAFYEKRSNILAPRNASIPVYSGLTLPDENIGIVTNRGIEAQFKHKNHIKNLNYSIGGQFTYSKSKILFIDEASTVPEWQRRTGKPVDFILLYQANGIYQNQAEVDNSVRFPDAKVGDVRVVDTNKDGVINELDKIILENSPTPRIVYGVDMGWEWKGLALNVLFQGQAKAQTIYRPFDVNQQAAFYENRWQSELRTPNATLPAAFDTASSSYREVSTVWVKNNSFLRLKNVELSYSFNKEMLDHIGLQALRIFVAGNNLLILKDKVKINDPESNSSTGWFYPQQRLLSSGINLTF